MKETNSKAISFCGLFCLDCPGYTGSIADLARDLRQELRRTRFDLTADYMAELHVFKEFKDYRTCYEVLGAMVKFRCRRLCREGGGNPYCKIRKCCQKKGMEGCWECAGFAECEKLDYLKPNHGDAHIKNLRKIRIKGFPGFLAGQKLWYSPPGPKKSS
jgi:hypothetical protein